MNVLDLFSGIGGFSLGLERAGMRTIAFCEIDPYCRAVLRKHWPDVPVFGDVREFSGVPADVICGGFPCQDISVAGKGAGIEGERSGLWSEYARIIGEVRPRYVIIENVSALISGRDAYEYPNDRCLCGWPYRWRGLHQHRTPQRASVLSPRGRGNGVEGLASTGGIESDLRRLDPSNAPAVGEMGGGAGVAVIWPSAGSIPGGNPAASAVEAGTGAARAGLAAIDRLSAEEAEWVSFVDRGGDETSEGNSRLDDRIEPQRADAYRNGGLVCEACGRDVDHAPTRSGVTTWMGRVLGDLAALGFDAEWHCIPASAVGAPHRRDRIWIVADADEPRPQGWLGAELQQRASEFAAGPGRSQWDEQRWFAQSGMGRISNGTANRVDRLRALGNAIVPQIAEIIGRAIMNAERDEYDADDDITKSFDEAYRVIRERMANGGPGWTPKP